MSEVTAHGRRVDVFFDGVFVTLVHHRASSVGKSVKRIPLLQIAGVRWNDASHTSAGFIEFSAPATVASENAATFTRTQQQAFEQFRTAVEAAIAACADRP
jgi:hypothetical protein